MSVDTNELLALPIEEKLKLVELLWDNLGDETEPLLLPVWARKETERRQREHNADPMMGSTSTMWEPYRN